MPTKLVQIPPIRTVNRNVVDPQTPRNAKERSHRVQQSAAECSKKRPHAVYIPPAQQERILQLHLSGKSVRSISRTAGRNPRTVANIILKNSGELKRYLEESRAQFLALIPLALAAVRKELASGGAEYAYRFLKDTGIVGSSIVRASDNLATETSEQLSGSDQYFISLLKMAHQRAKDFDLPPDALEMLPAPKDSRTIVEKTS